ncbi:2-acyl-glycerophospho-ethanolamine acyltransferase [Pseudaminobacter arsenicus]|uniref:2-acyl-glycerophospho-ethanolamine acyltransferase n=1 Tax=Borborobacter arsenicus TaxID=1851146 RepID=A0A432V2S9_9HYPH|nr:AMP-binding protein [Pseudaminobacter arsenicus]RUM96418.1 2-acyl-glycerophospho-ethanolamine acyltransferase [Pseudaminobacter arsenicus]
MILASSIALGIVAAYLAVAILQIVRLRLGFRQALLYVPLKLVYRIRDRKVRAARAVQTPVIYAITHQSRLDPALMLSLLPEDTLHILDDESARSPWLEPWRALARTIVFKAEHVFVSRRLVRVLKGRGRLAVYLPDTIEPDTKTYRLFRAVARIALRADAKVVPIFVGEARYLPFSRSRATDGRRRLFPRLSVNTLEPITIAELMALSIKQPARASNALFDRLAEARLAAPDPKRSLFLALRDAAFRYGPHHPIVESFEQAESGRMHATLSYRQLFVGARTFGHRFASVTAPGEAVGVLLPNTADMVVSLLALWSGDRVAAMIKPETQSAGITTAIRTALVRTVVSSRSFIANAGLSQAVEAAEKGGAKFVWLEDVRKNITIAEKLVAAALWWWPVHMRQEAATPAAILFTSGREADPKAVVLSHANLLANARQLEARLSIGLDDSLLNLLPVSRTFSLTGGIVLPLLAGARLLLDREALGSQREAAIAAKIRPSIILGNDTSLAAHGRLAENFNLSGLRFAMVGTGTVDDETRRIWRERFGARIVEGFGLTEAAPVVSINTATHNREGTAGRLLPGMRMKLEPVSGIPQAGRLLIQGPNLMLGYMRASQPGVLQALGDGWHDTGDIVDVDREGFLTVMGRAGRIASVGGEIVSLDAVEALACQLWPDGQHAAIAVPDKHKGEQVTLVTTADEPDLLRQFGRLAGASDRLIPHDIITIADLPRLDSGRIDYAAVRQMALQRLGIVAAA